MTVTTGTFGGLYGLGGEIASWDTEDPRSGPLPAGEIVFVDGLSMTWQTDVLPPVAQPMTVAFKLYMSGPAVDGGQWLPFGIGDAVTIYAYAYRDDLTEAEVFTVKGRVADLSGANARAGGILFSVVVADRLADLGSAGAPAEIDPSAGADPTYDLFNVYDALADDAEIVLDYQANRTSPPFTYWGTLQTPLDLTNVSTLDALTTAVAHDVRVSEDFSHTITRWLTQQINAGTTDPEADATYVLNEWDPEAVNDLAGALALHWTGSQWVVIPNPDYYTDGGAGMVLDASQVARDVGEWRQTRDQAINTVEGTAALEFDDGTKSKRATHPDLVAAYGPNTRGVPDWWLDADDARAYLYEILLTRNQVQAEGFGLSSLLVAWETLSDDALTAWATRLSPRGGSLAVSDDHHPLGRPFTVVNVPAEWRLVEGPAVTGRMMGCTLTLAEGLVRIALTTRTVPPSAGDGITIDELDAIVAPTPVTFTNLDPTASIDTFAIVGATAI